MATRAGRTFCGFVEEVQIGGQLQHPGIVQVYEIGLQSNSDPFFVMRLVKGRTLAELLRERGDLKEDLTRYLGIFLQICHAMGYAHEHSILHRDIKPANVLIDEEGEPHLTDFGLAKGASTPLLRVRRPISRKRESW